MADERKPKHPREDPAKKPAQDDEVVGKVYDAHLTRRLLTYLRPYKLQTGLSCASIIFKAASDVSGPYLFKVAIDAYLTPAYTGVPDPHPSWLARHLSHVPMTGITELGLIYLASLLFTFVLELL